MFYEPRSGHGLPHDPFNAIVLPRPIGWISTVAPGGAVNLAPFSFFNAVAYTPPQVMFATTAAHREGGHKDSVRNALATGEFVVNLATHAVREAVNLTSTPAPRGIDELELAGLTPVPSRLVAPPRVGESPVHLECRVVTSVELPTADPDDPNTVVFGEVVGVHIADELLVDGLVDVRRLRPIGRLGYREYVDVTDSFTMTRPGWPLPEVDAPPPAAMRQCGGEADAFRGVPSPKARDSSGGNPLGGFPLANKTRPVPGLGVEPRCPEGRSVLSRLRLTSSATPARDG